MKKILSFILAALMTASCAAYVAADDAAVEATASNAEQDYAIEFLANYGIFKGGEGLTNEDLIQRYQMALFVSRISTGWVEDEKWEDGTANNATFKDIEDGAAANYLGAISYANQNGIIEGYTANTFAPYDSITYRDALTMVVRTLGYKGLTYPWGYIEKAVELDLTKSIGSDVAYTDELTRGEVALIIYNAMFADTAKGNTLAKSIFDIDFKWQNIIVVSTDEYTTVSDKNGAVYAAKEGYVGFKTIDDDGVVGDKVYYVAESEMGLDKDHDAELAVGSVYMALFEAVDGNFVTLVDSDSALMATVVNNGITDNEGKAVAEDDMPIAQAIKPYELVKKTTKGLVSYDLDDLIVYGYQNFAVVDEDGNAKLIGIDAANNIVLWNACDKDTHGKEGHVCGWTIEWFYNPTLQRYYQYIVDEKNADKDAKGNVYTVMGDKTVYINWMDETDFIKWYNANSAELKATLSTLQPLEAAATAMLEGKAPYAKLNLFDLDRDEDGLAEIATYKTYSIGTFANSTKKCTSKENAVDHSAGKDMPSYKITTLAGAEVCNVFVEAGHEAHDTDLAAGFAWINVDDSVSNFVNEDGTYNDGVVLYNWNKTTGEIEIVKYITDKATDDADSYIVTGILQAYSTKNGTVTINGVSYEIGYKNLSGVMFNVASSDIATRAAWADILDDQYMQYVKAVVCDGRVVKTELVGNTNAAIVVLGYAGITSDAYIAVYGYKTDDLVLDTFKINSFNGWKQGDYRYNPTNAEDDGAFDFGSLYEIKSYDKETDSYGVYTENVESVLAAAKPVQITFKKGYRSVQPMSIVKDNNGYDVEAEEGKDPTIVAMSDADKYVLIDGLGNIYVHSGIITEKRKQQEINGLMVGAADSKYIVVYSYDNLDGLTLDSNVEFSTAITANAFDIGYVLYEKANGKVLDAAYDDAIAKDWYLLGSTESEVTVFDLLNGTYNVVLTSTNIDLVNGHIYKTYGGKILQDVTDKCGNADSATFMHDFVHTIKVNYASEDIDYADYIIKTPVALRSEDIVDAKGNKTFVELAFKLGLVKGSHTDKVNMAIANKLVTGYTLYKVTESDTWNLYTDHNKLTEVAPATLEAKYTYYADLIYNVATGKVVIYIYEDVEGKDDAKADLTTKEFNATLYEGGTDKAYDTTKAWSVKINDKERFFDIETKYTVVATYEDKDCRGPVKSMELTGVEMTLVEVTVDDKGVPTFTDIDACGDGNELHDALAGLGMCFGNEVTIGKWDEVTINGVEFFVGADEMVVSRKDCGLTYKVAIDLTENGKEIAINVDDEETVLNVVAANINGTITLTHNFAIDTTNSEVEVTTPVFTGFDGAAAYKRTANEDVYRLEVKAVENDKIVIW